MKRHRFGRNFAHALIVAAAALASLAPAGAREQQDIKPVVVATAIAVPTAPQFFTINQVIAARQGKEAPPPREEAKVDAPFAAHGYRLFGAANADIAGKWSSIRETFAMERSFIDICRMLGPACQDEASADFLAIVDTAAGKQGRARLATINARVNASIAYASDAVVFGVADRWQSPLKALGARGDCEDYAIAKYFLLEAAGVSPKDMRIVLTHDGAGGDHAVLAVRQEGDWLLLDNRWDRLTVDNADRASSPVFALNETGAQMYAAPFRPHEAFRLASR